MIITPDLNAKPCIRVYQPFCYFTYGIVALMKFNGSLTKRSNWKLYRTDDNISFEEKKEDQLKADRTGIRGLSPSVRPMVLLISFTPWIPHHGDLVTEVHRPLDTSSLRSSWWYCQHDQHVVLLFLCNVCLIYDPGTGGWKWYTAVYHKDYAQS